MAGTGVTALSLRFTRDDGTVVVHVAGELDVATSPALRKALVDVIDQQGSLSVRLDLGHMTFIDSTGLAILIGSHDRLTGKGGDLTLANVRPYTRKVLEVVGFARVFDVR